MEKTDNRSTGNKFEQELSHELAQAGFWVHVMQQNKAGQPADIIAIKEKFHTLIDCKVCEKGIFVFRRVEENQRFAMTTFFRKAGELCYFALKMPNGDIRMISLTRIDLLAARGKKSLNADELKTEARLLEDWLYYYSERNDKE